LNRFGIESPLQLAITICVGCLIVVPTLADPSTALVFVATQSLMVLLAILCLLGSRDYDKRISTTFLGFLAIWVLLALISIGRMPGSHFDALLIFYRHVFSIGALLSLAYYNQRSSARWKATILAVLIAVSLGHLLPELIRPHRPVAGFSHYNPDYFGTFLLIGLAASMATAVFVALPVWRLVGAAAALALFFGITQTLSRGAVLAAVLMVIVLAIRSRDHIPRRLWFAIGVGIILVVTISSPVLMRKFVDRGDTDPYNYARIHIWASSLRVVAEHPILGVGFGQFLNVSKRFNFPVDGQVARYERHVGMAHSEYIEHMAELGIPSALLLFSLLVYLVYVAWKRTSTTPPDHRCFQEAAILTAIGVGAHSAVDNCWTVPVLTSAVVALSLADLLPAQHSGTASSGVLPRRNRSSLSRLGFALVGILIATIYVYSTAVPGLAVYYNDLGQRSYLKPDYERAEQYYFEALRVVPDNPVFLQNLSRVYIAKFDQTGDRRFVDRARSYLGAAIAAAPQAVEPYLKMEDALVRSITGDEQQDLEWHKRIVENNTRLLALDPYLPFPRKNLAAAYYNLGQRERAFEEMQRAIEYEPNYVPGYLQMATWYGDRGDAAEQARYTAAAVSIIKKYRDYKPDFPYQAILLGRPESDWKR